MGIEHIAETFLGFGIQEWGQSEDLKKAAIQAALDAAGFDAKAEGSIVFGGIMTKVCSGPDGKKATAWLQELLDTMPRGRFQTEVAHIEKCISDRRALDDARNDTTGEGDFGG